MLRIGLVAGEASGDLLGAGLMRAIRARRPDVVFEGVPGPRMMAEGCRALYRMERLSVMGIAEVVGRLRELRAMRAGLVRHFSAEPPAAFVGIELWEFSELIHEGAGPQRSGFLSAFFALVGTHGLHVSFGIVWLVVLMVQVTRRGLIGANQRRITCLSLFWHFLDLVWIGVFTFVYLLGVLR